jgi:hypothetical protein
MIKAGEAKLKELGKKLEEIEKDDVKKDNPKGGGDESSK